MNHSLHISTTIVSISIFIQHKSSSKSTCLHILTSVRLITWLCLTFCNPIDCSTSGFPYPSQTPRACSNSCSSSRWCHPTISSSVFPFSSWPQSLPASGSFQMSQQIAWGGQSTGVSASTSVPNEHPGLISLRMDWLDLLAVQGTLKSLLQYHSSKASILQCSDFFIVQLSHPYMTTGKNYSFD